MAVILNPRNRIENNKMISHSLHPYELAGCEKVSKIIAGHHFHAVNTKSQMPSTVDFEHHILQNWNKELLPMSNLFGRPLSQGDLFSLIFLLMQMEIENSAQERVSRQIDRIWQDQATQLVVKGYRDMSSSLKMSGIISLTMGIASGCVMIGGQIGGETLVRLLGNVYSPFKTMDSSKAMDAIAKMLGAGSEFGKVTGQVQQCHEQSNIAHNESKSANHRTDGDNTTRNLENKHQTFIDLKRMIEEELQKRQSHEQQLSR